MLRCVECDVHALMEFKSFLHSCHVLRLAFSGVDHIFRHTRYGVFFPLNVYLLQEHRHLVPAKDTEAKTRFRR